MSKPRWEQLVRLRLLRAPRHCSANDSIRSLLSAAALVLLSCVALCSFCPAALQSALCGFGIVFSGLALQQYAWYTVSTFAECWSDEAPAVVMIMLLASALLGVMNLLVAVLLPWWPRVAFQVISFLAISTCHQWAPWGSLFDGIDKVGKAQ